MDYDRYVLDGLESATSDARLNNQQAAICCTDRGIDSFLVFLASPEDQQARDAPCGRLGLIDALVSLDTVPFEMLRTSFWGRHVAMVYAPMNTGYHSRSAFNGQSHDRTLYVELPDSVPRIQI